MKHRWIALLLALLCGCGVQKEPPVENTPVTPDVPVEAPTEPEKPSGEEEVALSEPPAVEAPAAVTTNPDQSEKPEKVSGDPTAVVMINGNETKMLTNGDTSGCIELTDGAVIEISWPKQRNIDRVLLEGLNLKGIFTISNQGKVLYSQELYEDAHWCYIDPQITSSLTLSIPKGVSLSEITVSAPAEDPQSRFSAYLPYSSFTDQMLTNGSLEALDELTINVGCYWRGDGTLEVKDGLTDIIAKIKKACPELEIYCTINPKAGGAAAIMTQSKRDILIKNMVAFCQQNQLSGVDIDWEFPADDQWDEFNALLSELGHGLDEDGLKLSAAFYPGKAQLTSDALVVLSKINIMAYDQFDEQGRHSTYEGAQEAIDYFVELDAWPSQLSLGIPAYGRPLSGEAVWPLYCDYADALIETGSLLNSNYFNAPQLVQDKTVLAQEAGLHGVFLYHLGCDLPGSDSRSLTSSIAEIIKP